MGILGINGDGEAIFPPASTAPGLTLEGSIQAAFGSEVGVRKVPDAGVGPALRGRLAGNVVSLSSLSCRVRCGLPARIPEARGNLG